MTNTVAEAVAWVEAHPTTKGVEAYRIGYGYSWSQLCVALTFHALGATRSAASANLARAQSHLLPGTEKLVLPVGAFPWFDYGKFGHVGFGYSPGRFISATRFASDLGTALGTLTPAEYAELSGGTYLGYSWDFCGQTFNGISTAGVGTVTPLSAPIGKRDMDKYIILWSNAGGGSQYRVADFATLTYRVAGGNEINAIKAEDAAGRLHVYPVAEADWNKDYAAWKLVTAPVATGSASATNLQPVLDQLAAIGKLEAADQTALITAINNLPAAVRTKIIAP